MEYNRAAMKLEVKQIMRATRPRPIWVTLLYLVIVSVGAWVIRTVIGGIIGVGAFASSLAELSESMINSGDFELAAERFFELVLVSGDLFSRFALGSFLISILSYLWSSTMGAGYIGYALDMVRGKAAGPKTIFSAFPKFGKVLITNILVGVFTTLWALLFYVGLIIVVIVAALLMAAVPVAGAMLMFAAFVFFAVGMLWVTLRFALTSYLVMDQGISGLEALTVSKKLMKGNKWRLFVLQLSFVGWYLLEALVVLFFVGMIMMSVLLMLGGAAGGIIAGVILMMVSFLALSVVSLLFSMWLTPYTSGATVRFYEYTMSRRPDMFSPKPSGDDSFGHPGYPRLD